MTRRIELLFAFLLFLGNAVAFLPLSAAEAINGKSLKLEKGVIVRLACLQAPNITEITGKMRPGEPMGKEAREALQTLVEGQELRLSPEPPLLDRHGRRIAFVTLKDGRLVQEEILKQGMALVYPFADQRQIVPKLLAAEREARQARRGIWRNIYWQPKKAEEVRAEKERYQLVQGVVRQVAQAGGNWYLNFGEDFRTDFTAMIKQADYQAYFKHQNLKELQGKTLLLRGWIYRYNGVMMDIILPEQIEVLDAAEI